MNNYRLYDGHKIEFRRKVVIELYVDDQYQGTWPNDYGGTNGTEECIMAYYNENIKPRLDDQDECDAADDWKRDN